MSTKIVYIEDNEQNFYLVNFILTAKGYEVIWARDGQSGLDLAAEHKPALILTDIQLPVMDGYQVASALRENPSHAGRPIVALTSHAMPGDREKALAAGCSGYMEKPINPATFAEQIAALIAKAGTT